MTQRIPSEIAFLAECGVQFSMEGSRIQVFKIPGHRIPGHRHPRHVSGVNWKGRDLTLPLNHRARQLGIQFFEHVFVTRLMAANGHVTAAAGLSAEGRFGCFRPKRSYWQQAASAWSIATPTMRLVAEMVCRAALFRTESRGLHFCQDFPEEDNDNWSGNIEVAKGPAGMALNVIC